MDRLILADPVTSLFTSDVKVPQGPDPSEAASEERDAAAEARRKDRRRAAGATGVQRSLLSGTSGATSGGRRSLLGSSS